mgnify:FL=1
MKRNKPEKGRRLEKQRGQGFIKTKGSRSQGFKDSRIQVVLLVSFFQNLEAKGSRIHKDKGFKESRIQGVEWFSWYLFPKPKEARGQGVKWRKAEG